MDNGVNGLAPASYDVSTVSQSDLKEIVPIVAVLLALLLGLVLRSVIAPLYLVATVLLELFRRAGHRGADLPGRRWRRPGSNFVLPFLLFVFLMALGEDYNILVMSRIREEARKAPLRAGGADACTTPAPR